MTPSGIPRSLTPCFQEYDIEQLNPVEHQHLIIERVLAYGNRIELYWLFDQYGRAKVIDWVKQDGALRLPWRRYNLWCILLNLISTQTSPSKGTTDMALLKPHWEVITPAMRRLLGAPSKVAYDDEPS